MSVTREEVLHVATLARLSLEPSEIERFTEQLNGILAHVEALQAVDVEGVEALAGAASGAAPLRADEPGADPLTLALSALAPSWMNGFFTVPRLAALDARAAERGE